LVGVFDTGCDGGFRLSPVAVVFSLVAVVYAGLVGRVNLDLLFADLDC